MLKARIFDIFSHPLEALHQLDVSAQLKKVKRIQSKNKSGPFILAVNLPLKHELL